MTVAVRLAEEHGLRLVSAEQFSAYVPRTTPEDAPLLHAFLAMDMDERWVTRSPEAMYETFHGFHGETFPLLVERARPLRAELREQLVVCGELALPHRAVDTHDLLESLRRKV